MSNVVDLDKRRNRKKEERPNTEDQSNGVDELRANIDKNKAKELAAKKERDKRNEAIKKSLKPRAPKK